MVTQTTLSCALLDIGGTNQNSVMGNDHVNVTCLSDCTSNCACRRNTYGPQDYASQKSTN